MLLALIAILLMLLGTCLLVEFGRRVSGLLEKWSHDPGPAARAPRRS